MEASLFFCGIIVELLLSGFFGFLVIPLRSGYVAGGISFLAAAYYTSFQLWSFTIWHWVFFVSLLRSLARHYARCVSIGCCRSEPAWACFLLFSISIWRGFNVFMVWLVFAGMACLYVSNAWRLGAFCRYCAWAGFSRTALHLDIAWHSLWLLQFYSASCATCTCGARRLSEQDF